MEFETSQHLPIAERVEGAHAGAPLPFAEAPGGTTEAPAAEVFTPRSTDVPVEVILDSYRVTGELFAPGVPRRLVDILNSNDSSYFTMRSGRLDDPFSPEGEAREFDLIQLDKHGILFAIPRGEVHKPDPFEVVRKKRLHSTIVLPGYMVSGELYLMPDADPNLVPIVSDHHFVPLTDATVMADNGRPQTWEEPLLIVNMTRAVFFGMKGSG